MLVNRKKRYNLEALKGETKNQQRSIKMSQWKELGKIWHNKERKI